MDAANEISDAYDELITAYSHSGESIGRSLDNDLFEHSRFIANDKLLGRDNPRAWWEHLYRSSFQLSLFPGIEWTGDGTLALGLLMTALKVRRKRIGVRGKDLLANIDDISIRLEELIRMSGTSAEALALTTQNSAKKILGEARDRVYLRNHALWEFENQVGVITLPPIESEPSF